MAVLVKREHGMRVDVDLRLLRRSLAGPFVRVFM